MKGHAKFWVGCALLSIVLGGCNRYQVIPDRLVKQVNEQVPYEQVKDSPETYRGQIVVWGGEVLSATRDVNRTKVEVLQLPLNEDHIPLDTRASSRGRFFAMDSRGEIIDPAVLKEGIRITIIGEILGLRTETHEKVAYDYPVIAIRDMTVWDSRTRTYNPFGGFSNSHGYGYSGYRPYTFWEGTRVPGS